MKVTRKTNERKEERTKKKKKKKKTKRTKNKNIKVKGVGKIWNASRICVSSLRRGHANLLYIVPILIHVFQRIRLTDEIWDIYTTKFGIDINHRSVDRQFQYWIFNENGGGLIDSLQQLSKIIKTTKHTSYLNRLLPNTITADNI